MGACEQKVTLQWFHSLVHKGSGSIYCPGISGSLSGKEMEMPSYGSACPVGSWTTKASWFPFLPPITAPRLVGSLSHLYPVGLANLPFLLLREHILLQGKGRPRQTAGSERPGGQGIARGHLSCMVPEARHLQMSRRWCHWHFYSTALVIL